MKVCFVDTENYRLVLSIDFLEAECLGYDTVKRQVVYDGYYETILRMISDRVHHFFGADFKYGIKTYIDPDKGMFYYDIKPYDIRLDEFVLEEMIKNQCKTVFFYPQGL